MKDHTDWCKTQHGLIKNGGVWGVPRSGLMFTRTAAGFDLTQVMPFTDDMGMASVMGKDVPSTPIELLAYQRKDFACIQREFKKAGIEVSDPMDLLDGAELVITEI